MTRRKILKPLLSKSILDKAKSFLCWELYPDLSIKLIAIDNAIAFYYPPTKDFSTIIIFYNKNCNDFSNAIFLLFHEVGHHEQFKIHQNSDNLKQFWDLINLDKGELKLKFEHEAWNRGEIRLKDFIEKFGLKNPTIIEAYTNFAEKCLLSYK